MAALQTTIAGTTAKRHGTVQLPIVDPPQTTMIQLPIWRFGRFSEFPDEIQLMIWEAALEPAFSRQPRLIAAHTMVPPISETHLMVRVLAQTCVKSRQVALPLLKSCMNHEELHYMAIPRAPDPRPAPPAPQGAPAAALQAANQAAALLLNVMPNGNNQQQAAAAPLNTPPAPLRRLTAKERRNYKFNGYGDGLVETHYKLNGLHNHIHVDDDYLLFLDQTIGHLEHDATRFVSILSRVEKIMAPASTWYKFFRANSGEVHVDDPHPDWLPSAAKEVVMILPICSDIRDYDSVYLQSFAEHAGPSLTHDDSYRWSESSEIPYGLLQFWTDEEMALFEDSFRSRWCYHLEQAVQADTIRMPIYDIRSKVPEVTTVTAAILGERVAQYKSHIASRPRTRNVFDEWKDPHLLFGLWHIWTRIQKMHGKVPPPRFAHVKGLAAYDFLAEAQGKTRQAAHLNWREYIPRYSCKEIHKTLMHGRYVHLDTKRRSERFPLGGDGGPAAPDSALVERLKRFIPAEAARIHGAPRRSDEGWRELTDREFEFRLDRYSQFSWQAINWGMRFRDNGGGDWGESDRSPAVSPEGDEERQEKMWEMCCGEGGEDPVNFNDEDSGEC
ncbi:hypothetical protein QBC44DRAFT_379448 [Cladorrhinum sp. PSN332]|nr:hypothetical protein QBC44DRAFT_379448 [Cladorrhinum sp. PSN332]